MDHKCFCVDDLTTTCYLTFLVGNLLGFRMFDYTALRAYGAATMGLATTSCCRSRCFRTLGFHSRRNARNIKGRLLVHIAGLDARPLAEPEIRGLGILLVLVPKEHTRIRTISTRWILVLIENHTLPHRSLRTIRILRHRHTILGTPLFDRGISISERALLPAREIGLAIGLIYI